MALKHTHTRRSAVGGLLLGIAVLLPQVFHAIPGAGNILLPMHLPVLLCGLLLGPWYGTAIGAVAPCISHLVSGMPPAARLPFMVLELAVYGLCSGLLARKLDVSRHKGRIYLCLIGAMLAGRLVYAAALWVAADLLGIPGAGPIAAVTATVTGAWGIVIQLTLLPLTWLALDKGGLTLGLSGSSPHSAEK